MLLLIGTPFPAINVPSWLLLAVRNRVTRWPEGSRDRAVASLDPRSVFVVRMTAPPIEAGSGLHCFVVLSAGFQKSGPPTYDAVLNGSEQMQLAPSWPHRCSSAMA